MGTDFLYFKTVLVFIAFFTTKITTVMTLVVEVLENLSKSAIFSIEAKVANLQQKWQIFHGESGKNKGNFFHGKSAHTIVNEI